jgi:hypothetical protein
VSDELKPCPFCGDEAELCVRLPRFPGYPDGIAYTASCKGSIDPDCCGSNYFDYKTKEWAVAAWNRRVGATP